MIKIIQFIGIGLLFSTVIQAGTVIEVQDQDVLTKIMTDGQQARIDMSASEFVIVNYEDQSVRMVDQQNKQVMLFDGGTAMAANNAVKINVAVKKLGSGQTIAGFKTEKFSYTANGKPCGIILGSKQAYQVKGIKELVNAVSIMIEKQSAILGGLVGMMDDCERADMELNNFTNTIGIPMRTEVDGRVDTEIKSIKTDVALPADAFVIPASYKTVTMQQQVEAASKGMDQAQQKMQENNYQPQLDQMMKGMQQLEQLTPEMMEQMRQAQEMMKQYQQQ